MKILVLYRKGTSCDYHRVFMPLRLLPLENGEEINFKPEDEECRTVDFKVDLVIFNRHPHRDLSQVLKMKKEYGFKMWVDIDDSWELEKEHYLYEEWKRAKIGDLIIKSMSEADILTVTNTRLLRKVAPINSKCIIIPNALPIGHEQFIPNRTESSFLRFLYAGGPSHYGDLKKIDEYFKMCGRNLIMLSKVKFIMAGYNPNYKEKSLKDMNDIMSSSPNYETRLALPLERYMDHYNYADIAIAPVDSNLFNHYKSNLKTIEAGCMGVPLIASRCFPYIEDEEMSDKGIFFCSNIKEWYDTTLMLARNPETVLKAGETLYQYVKSKYDLLEINKLRRKIINSFK